MTTNVIVKNPENSHHCIMIKLQDKNSGKNWVKSHVKPIILEPGESTNPTDLVVYDTRRLIIEEVK